MTKKSLTLTLVSGALVAALLSGCGSLGHRSRAMRVGHGFAGSSGDAPRAEPAALFLAGLDGNLDTVVTPDELRGALGRLFAAADQSKDGTISVLELNDWRRHWFGSADGWPGQFHFNSDGNGVISQKEFDAGLELCLQTSTPTRTASSTAPSF